MHFDLFYLVTVIYTFIWNVLDMPAGVVRFGTESGKLFPTTNTENDSYLEMCKKALPSSTGLPINVQVIGKPFQEELVLRALCELENLYEKAQVQMQNNSLKIMTNGNGKGKQNGNMSKK